MSIPPVLVSCQIIENKETAPKYFLMKIDSPELAGRVVPGQFFHIKVADRLDIILRRPISMFDYNETSVSILYEVVGKGTALLSEKKPGEELDILGPLGNGFSMPIDEKKIFIVAGGMGVASLFSLAKEIKKMKNKEIFVLMGANNKYKIICEDNFKKIGLAPEIATDNGSYGCKGLVTELFKKRVENHELKTIAVYGCGPHEMLKELSNILNGHNIKGELSMDTHMGCGMGVCLGCVIKTRDGKYKRVCKDGPVFKADEIVWE